jgi:small subunit ribosomal protein S9
MEKKTTTAKEKKPIKATTSTQEEKPEVLESEETQGFQESKESRELNLETFEFKGEYLKSVGRRKTSVAQVRMYKDGKGIIVINGKKGSHYFVGDGISIATQPLKVTGHVRDLNFSIIVKGGGVSGQIEACRHGITRALLLLDPLLKDSLKVHGFLTRDPRQKERKKPGLKGARKRPQWSKR